MTDQTDQPCEQCGVMPARAMTPDDPEDPWYLCAAHEAELVFVITESREDSRLYSLAEVLAEHEHLKNLADPTEES